MSKVKMDRIVLKQISSQEKVFLKGEVEAPEVATMTALKGDVLAYQVAYTKTEEAEPHLLTCRCGFTVKVRSPLKKYIKVRAVGNVPSEMPVFYTHDGHDDYHITTEPGLYPDPLFDIPGDRVYAVSHLWHSMFVTLRLPDDIPAGEYPVDLVCKINDFQWNDECHVRFKNGKKSITLHMTVKVLDAKLPKTDFIFSQWFHTDCIAEYYGTRMFSERHWKLTEQFLKMAVDNGINTILTPIFTPPLDTFVGQERPTVQLIDIEKNGENYTFNFDKFDRWVEICKRCGVQNFEMAHLFTQWGAEKTPKIVAKVDGKKKRIFGWDVAADSKEYFGFLSQFLPALIERLKKLGIEKNTFFHISDEPSPNHLEHYKKLHAFVKPLLESFIIMDALSSYDFYKTGAVEAPIVSINHIAPFLENKVNPLFGYYCCGQTHKVSNRFFSMPASRNRAIAAPLFKYDINGFLTWGYNFYFSKGSEHLLNPFLVTDAVGAFPSGDSFSVYPGRNGPLESIRIIVFTQALCDLRAMRLLESKIGHDAVVAIIEEVAGQEIDFNEYPHTAEFMLDLRERINSEIEKVI